MVFCQWFHGMIESMERIVVTDSFYIVVCLVCSIPRLLNIYYPTLLQSRCIKGNNFVIILHSQQLQTFYYADIVDVVILKRFINNYLSCAAKNGYPTLLAEWVSSPHKMVAESSSTLY